MKSMSKKSLRDLQNLRFSDMPKKSKTSKKIVFHIPHKIIETVNLVDDSDEENTQENVTAFLMTPMNTDKSGQDFAITGNRSVRFANSNCRTSFNLDESCIKDTTRCENTFMHQNERLQDCDTNSPTTTNPFYETSHSRDNSDVNEWIPNEEIVTQEEQIKIDYHGASFSSSPTFTENDCANDDSDIVFVSETQNHQSYENSVIVIDDDNNAVRKLSKKARKRLRKREHQLMYNNALQETEQNCRKIKRLNTCNNTSGSNTFAREGLREIVIDGSNIAYGHSNGAYFSVRGLYIAIQYFLLRGHKVTAFVPQFRVKAGECSSPAFLQELADKRYVIFTPSREVLGKRITPYDDRFIIQYAHLKEAIIVSNDNYRDLLLEKPEWRSTIKNRLLMYTWIDDLLIFAEDPLGRYGPRLSDFLKFP